MSLKQFLSTMGVVSLNFVFNNAYSHTPDHSNTYNFKSKMIKKPPQSKDEKMIKKPPYSFDKDIIKEIPKKTNKKGISI